MIVARLQVHAADARARDEMLKLFRAVMGPTRAQPGCICCDLLISVIDLDKLYYVEQWETEAQLRRHIESDKYHLILAALEASASSPVVDFFPCAERWGMAYLLAAREGAAGHDRHESR